MRAPQVLLDFNSSLACVLITVIITDQLDQNLPDNKAQTYMLKVSSIQSNLFNSILFIWSPITTTYPLYCKVRKKIQIQRKITTIRQPIWRSIWSDSGKEKLPLHRKKAQWRTAICCDRVGVRGRRQLTPWLHPLWILPENRRQSYFGRVGGAFCSAESWQRIAVVVPDVKPWSLHQQKGREKKCAPSIHVCMPAVVVTIPCR